MTLHVFSGNIRRIQNFRYSPRFLWQGASNDK